MTKAGVQCNEKIRDWHELQTNFMKLNSSKNSDFFEKVGNTTSKI